MSREHLRYIFVYTFAYMAIGSMMPLVGRYLSEIGFSGEQIGVITASGTFIAIFSQIFWGSIYDRADKKKLVIGGIVLAAAAVCMGLAAVSVYIVFLLVHSLMFFFQAPVMGLVDAMSMKSDSSFGSLRMWGAVGYALGVFLSGRIAAATDMKAIFFMYASGFVLAALFVLRMKNEGDAASVQKKKAGGTKALLESKDYLKLLIAVFFIGGTNVANNTYFNFLYTDCGGTLAGMSFAMLLMVGSEAPFMAWSSRLSAKFTLEKMILAGMIISVIRFGWYATCPPAQLLTALFFMQGMVNGIVLVEIVRYIGRLVRAEAVGLAVSWYYAISSNASTIVCQLIGGAVLDRAGGGGVYLFFAIYNVIGVILYLCFGLHKKRPEQGT